MAFEYKVVTTVDEANQLSDDGFELFTILPPGPAGGPDRMYLRRDKRRGQTPGFSRESKSESGEGSGSGKDPIDGILAGTFTGVVRNPANGGREFPPRCGFLVPGTGSSG